MKVFSRHGRLWGHVSGDFTFIQCSSPFLFSQFDFSQVTGCKGPLTRTRTSFLRLTNFLAEVSPLFSIKANSEAAYIFIVRWRNYIPHELASRLAFCFHQSTDFAVKLYRTKFKLNILTLKMEFVHKVCPKIGRNVGTFLRKYLHESETVTTWKYGLWKN